MNETNRRVSFWFPSASSHARRYIINYAFVMCLTGFKSDLMVDIYVCYILKLGVGENRF